MTDDERIIYRALLIWAAGLKKRADSDPFSDSRVGARFLEKAAKNIEEGLHLAAGLPASDAEGTVPG